MYILLITIIEYFWFLQSAKQSDIRIQKRKMVDHINPHTKSGP